MGLTEFFYLKFFQNGTWYLFLSGMFVISFSLQTIVLQTVFFYLKDDSHVQQLVGTFCVERKKGKKHRFYSEIRFLEDS